MRILSLQVDDGGCGWYRVRQPLAMIGKHTDHEAHVVDPQKDHPMSVLDALNVADVVIMRPRAEKSLETIPQTVNDYRKEKGIKEKWDPVWVMDIDDNVENISPYSNHYKDHGVEEVKHGNDWLWKDGQGGFDIQQNRENQQSLIDAFGKVDLIQVTTSKLQEYAQQYNDNVAVLPNCVNLDTWWKLPFKKNRKLRIGWSGGSCSDDKTEVLTDGGFKFFKDLDGTEKIATLNPNSHELEYQKPIRLVKNKHKGKLNVVEKNHIDFAVTDNHKHYIAKPKKSGKKRDLDYRLVKTENLSGKNFFKRNCKWSGKKQEWFTLPETKTEYPNRKDKVYPEKKIPMDEWLMFFGFWLAEGWTTKTTYKGWKDREYRLMQVGVVQSKDNEYLEVMQGLLEGWGFNTRMQDKQLRVFDKQLWQYLYQFGGAKDKYIPKSILNLDSSYLEVLFEWYLNGDGNREENEENIKARVRSWTSSKELADNLVELAVKIGWTASVYTRERKAPKIKGRTVNSSPSFQVSYLRNDGKYNYLRPLVHQSEIEKVDYNGYVYSVDVPNHIIYVRRNGKCHWTGNSHYVDLYSIKEPLNKLMREYDFQFVFVGHHFPGIIDDDNKKNMENHAWVPFNGHSYRSMCMNLDIAIAPVKADFEFNWYKSSIKYTEYSAMEVPTLATDCLPYNDVITDGENGLLYKDEDEFYKKMKKLIEDEKLRRKLGKEARKWVEENRDAKKCVKIWTDAYQQAIERKNG